MTTTIYIVIFLARQNIARSGAASRRSGSLTRLMMRRKRRHASNNFIQNYADNINLRAAKSIFQNEIEWAVSRDVAALTAAVDQQTNVVSSRPEADLDLSHSPKSWVKYSH